MLPEEREEIEKILMEATSEVEKSLSIEDKGWLKLGTANQTDMLAATRSAYVLRSRTYYNMDPLAKQAIRLWTDYSFGSGISYQVPVAKTKSEDGTEIEEDRSATQEALDKFWHNPANRSVLSAKGQRKSSDKALVDGEVFFALFLGADGEVLIRWIDPQEITEIITDPDDAEAPMYYRRDWSNTLNVSKTSYYRSTINIKDKATPCSTGQSITSTEGAIVYHVAINTIGQRGMPLLLPVIDWIDQYRRFLASRIAIVRALARFAWKNKVMGGAAAVAQVKAATEGKYPQAGSTWIENQGSNLEPIKTDTGASGAESDGRMIRNQICVGVGIFPHYMGDLETSNLATATAVELPMIKQFSAYQQIWSDVFQDIHSIVLEHNGVPEDKRFVDLDFPEIAPSDAVAALAAIQSLVAAFPQTADIQDVLKQALINIGLNNVQEIIDGLPEKEEATEQPTAAQPETEANLIQALQKYTEAISK
jgi:hypothetical protein